MFLKHPKLGFLRTIGSRAFVHVERHQSKIEEKAWEGVLIGYDSDSPSYRIYNRYTGKISSSRNVTFIEQAIGAPYSDRDFSTLDTLDPDDSEQHDDSIDFNLNVYDGIAQLEDSTVEESSPTTEPPIAQRGLRSSGGSSRHSSEPSNKRQASELRRLALLTTEDQHHATTLEMVCQYIGTCLLYTSPSPRDRG